MIIAPGGIFVEQKVVTVPNNDEEMNASIASEAADSWLVTSITLSDTNVIILFTRTTAAS